jgi:hypothetical protein
VLLFSKLKRTATYTLRFKMRLAINRELLLLKYRQNRSGARLAPRFSIGRTRDSLFTLAPARRLNITNPPIITVVGKAFFDIGHAPKDQSNRRKRQPGHAAWEIHPVMKLTVQ